MSGQAKRSRVLAAQRHREQVARAIADCQEHPLGTSRRVHGEYIGEGMHFDVHRAREYGERLVAEGLRWQGARAVVDDWRREQGLQPDLLRVDGRNIWCDPPGLPPGVSGSALNWQASVRLGRRLLAALEGQPSECQGCGGDGIAFARDARGDAWSYKEQCPDCHGTGHNLHGVLPPVEWSPAVRRKVVDAANTATGGSDWQTAAMDAVWASSDSQMRTRVVPRGEHRDESRIGARQWVPPSTVGIRAVAAIKAAQAGRPIPAVGPDLLPHWRRGEIKHAEQRRHRRRAPRPPKPRP